MLNKQSPNRVAWQLSLFSLAIVLIAIMGLRFVRTGNLTSFTGGTTYRLIADNLVNRGVYSVDGEHPTGYRPPAYPLVLAGLGIVLKEYSQSGALLANVAMDAGCLVVLLLLVGRLARDWRAVLFAGLLFAMDFPFHLEALAQRETMLYTLLLLTFMTVAARRNVAFGPLLLMTGAAALAWLTRPTGIALIPLLLIAAFFQSENRSIGIRIARVVTTCCLFTAIVLPWQMYLYRSFRAPVPAGTTSSGLNLYQGNNPAADVLIPFIDVDTYLPEVDSRLKNLGLPEHDELARDRQLKADAMKYILAKPASFVRRAIIKVLALYSPIPTPLGSANIDTSNGGVAMTNFRYHLSPWTFSITISGFAIIGVLAVAIRRWKYLLKRSPYATTLIVGYILIVTSLHAVTFAETRFRMPLDPLLIALGAAALFARSRDVIARQRSTP
ncbi:MAG: hypothetical protein H6819_00885 [Phycisphaerales bacterium]|nr:hypothetical protein [Phycisphaerales bacterium]MCB9857237.1 hypothetical protein [Phycisphaerales bacterium]MCB9863049.1 hypothetical protein [Phycisphaerales bacterium]